MSLARTVGIGIQIFSDIREENYFYIDKTSFIKEWWESGDSVTLITRPRRFGKTLTMSMVEQFFSVKYANRGDLFHGLKIWKEEKYHQLQGTYPVISLSFANIKEPDYESTKLRIYQLLTDLYSKNSFLLDSGLLTETEKQFFLSVNMNMKEVEATIAIHKMTDYLSRYYGKKVIILLDEYDTPMQEAYVNGYWQEMTSFTRSLFNATFKTNPYMARGIMTGITSVSKESRTPVEKAKGLMKIRKALLLETPISELLAMSEHMPYILTERFSYAQAKMIIDKEKIGDWVEIKLKK